MRVAHCVALSPVHYVAVLRLLVCNDSTDASDRVPWACQVCHLHRAIQCLCSCVTKWVRAASSLAAYICRRSVTTWCGKRSEPSVAGACIVLPHVGRCDLETLQILVFRASLASWVPCWRAFSRTTVGLFTASSISVWARVCAFPYGQRSCIQCCALWLARILALVGFVSCLLLIMMLRLHYWSVIPVSRDF